MPAGPLRAPLDAQMARADALIVIGDGGKAAPLTRPSHAQGKPVFKARIVPRQDNRWLGVLPVIGFAGIARPEKFFATLRNNGARLIDDALLPRPSPLHRAATRGACSKRPRAQNAMLVTTEKDFVRLPDDAARALGELKFRSRPLPSPSRLSSRMRSAR